MQIREVIGRFVEMLLEPVVGYTRVVWLMKYGLWITAAFIMCWLMLLPFLNPVHEHFNLNFSSIQKDASEKTRMLNPRFQGVDASGQPFYVTADSAIQQSEEVVLLDNVSGDITLSGGGWVSVAAQYGTMYTEKDELYLKKNVHLFTGDGYEFKTNKAIVYIEKNFIEGDEPVKGQGPSGTIDAGGFRIEQGGKKVIFNRHVKLRLYPGGEG